MKTEKIRKFLLKNIKIVISFVIGAVISGGAVYAATILFASNQVSYNSTNVQDALDNLYIKAYTWIDPSYIDFGTIRVNSRRTIF